MPASNQAQGQSVWTLFSKSSRIVSKNLKLFGSLMIPGLVLALWDTYESIRHSVNSSFSFVSSTNIDSSFRSNTGHMATWLFVVLVVASFVTALAVYVAAIEFSAGRKPRLSQVLSKLLDKGLGLVAVTVISGVAIIAGLFLLVIPGIYLLGKLYLAQYVYVAEDIGVINALKKSWRISQGRLWLIYSLLLLEILFSLANLLPWVGPIVALALVTLFEVAPALRYQELKNHNPEQKA